MSPGVNEGILRLCEAGIVRKVSLFANLDHVRCGLDRLLRFDHLRFSVHLNLTHGAPLSRPEEVPSLCRPDSLFQSLPTLLQNTVRGRLRAEEIELEGRRQIRRLKSLGVPLTGIEGHHHVHLIPKVFSSLSAALGEEGIRCIRIPIDKSHFPSRLAGLLFKHWLLSAKAPPRAHEFELLPTLCLRQRDLRTLESLKKKILASDGLPVIVHPALRNDLPQMKYFDPYQAERVLQFDKLLELSLGGGESALPYADIDRDRHE
jgi:predicted glycoside hydrolase/deacetylase ChbG (UPF0249 family)